MSILTDKCWVVWVKHWGDVGPRPGWTVQQRLDCTGYEVVSLLAKAAKDDDTRLEIEYNGVGPSVQHMLERARIEVDKAISVYAE